MTFILDEALPVLERTPALLRALLDGLPEEWVRATEGTGTWSAFDVVGHLIHGERTDWIPRTQRILKDGDRIPFERFDREAMFRESEGRTLPELLATFASLRAASLTKLEALQLSPRDLDRPGAHPELGPVTLGQLLATWVVHDLGHLGQIARVMAKRYRAEVGPWRAYLPILDR